MKKSFKKRYHFSMGTFSIAIVIFSLFLLALPAYTQESIQGSPSSTNQTIKNLDIVYLMDGRVIRGKIIKNNYNKKIQVARTLKILSFTRGEGVITVNYKVIVRVVKAGKVIFDKDAKEVYEKKSPALAGFFSLIPGAGHYYLGEKILGGVFLGLFTTGLIFVISSEISQEKTAKEKERTTAFLAVGSILMVVSWLTSTITATLSAIEKNKRIEKDELGQYRGTNTGRNSFGHLLEGGGEKLVWGFDISPTFKKSVALDVDKKGEGLAFNGFSLSLSLHY